MPWPIRFGPPPRITTFLRSEGAPRRPACRRTASRRSSTCRRSARRTRPRRCRCACRPGRTSSAWLRSLATCFSSLPVSVAEPRSEKPIAFSMRRFVASCGRPCARMRAFHVDDRLDLFQEPRVDMAAGMHLVALMPRRKACATMRSRSGVGVPMAARMAFLSSPSPRPGNLDLVEAGQAGLQAAQRLLQIPEGAADGHHFADRFHRRGQDRLGAGELLEGESAGSW
jgi:hypothetical protein